MSASLTPLSLNGMGVAADHGQSQARTIVIQLCQCYTFTEASYHKLQMYKVVPSVSVKVEILVLIAVIEMFIATPPILSKVYVSVSGYISGKRKSE